MIIDADPLVVFVVTMLANSGDGEQIKLAEKSARRVLRNIPAGAAKEFDVERAGGCPRREKTTSYLETAVNCFVGLAPANKWRDVTGAKWPIRAGVTL